MIINSGQIEKMWMKNGTDRLKMCGNVGNVDVRSKDEMISECLVDMFSVAKDNLVDKDKKK